MDHFLGDKETLKGITQTLMEARTAVSRAVVALENLEPLADEGTKIALMDIHTELSEQARNIKKIYESTATEAFK